MIKETNAVAYRQNLGEKISQVQFSRDSNVINKDGRDFAVLIHAKLFESIRRMQERFYELDARPSVPGPLAVLSAGVAMLVWTWGTWLDVRVDFGGEVYVAWRIAEGDVGYRDVAYFTGLYLRDPGDALHSWVSQLMAPDLGSLPPCLLVTAQCDLLRDEGAALAGAIAAAGVKVDYRCFAGLPHAFVGLGAVPIARRAIDDITAALAKLLEPVKSTITSSADALP